MTAREKRRSVGSFKAISSASSASLFNSAVPDFADGSTGPSSPEGGSEGYVFSPFFEAAEAVATAMGLVTSMMVLHLGHLTFLLVLPSSFDSSNLYLDLHDGQLIITKLLAF